VQRHLKPHIGATKLARLDAKTVPSLYRDKLAEGLCGGTVKRIHTTLNQAMREAVRLKYIRSNPLDDVRPPKEHRTESDVLTPEQVLHLLELVHGDRFECIYTLMALCGLRIGECLAVRWCDVDLQSGTLTVRRTLWRGQTTQPKTPSSRRTLALPERALDALTRHSSGQDGSVCALHEQESPFRPITSTGAVGDQC
jgi:integrase